MFICPACKQECDEQPERLYTMAEVDAQIASTLELAYKAEVEN
jgi:hypothetical protein